MLLQPANVDTNFNWGAESSIGRQFIKYLLLGKENLQLLYSQLNPLLILVILKPFRDFIHRSIFSVLCNMAETEQSGGSREKVEKIPQRQPTLQSETVTDQNSDKKLRVISGLAFGMTFICSAISLTLMTSQATLLKPDLLLAGKNEVDEMVVSKIFMKNIYADFNDASNNVQVQCGNKHGTFKHVFKRCFFVETFPSPGLNRDEQIAHCDSQGGSVLFYPRSVEELYWVWTFYKNYREWTPLTVLDTNDVWFLHLGLVRRHTTR